MELLYQDSQIVLCVKPAGLSSEAGAGSLPELLEDQLGRPVFPVHRLDRNVGGVMVYARTRQAASARAERGRQCRVFGICGGAALAILLL